MTFPIYQLGGFEYPVSMALAVLSGFGFGFVLERAGFGRASVLVSQFYGDDMRVLKVMFTGIVTTAIGLGLLSELQLVDLSALIVPTTFLWPHLVGGLLLGAGFVISGYCPGTALISLSSGHRDAIYVLVGLMIGAIGFGLAFPAIEGFYLSGDMGIAQLTELLGVSWPVLALALAAVAVMSFVGAERLERYLAKKRDVTPAAASPRVRSLSFAAVLFVAVLGLLSMGWPEPASSEQTAQDETDVIGVNALELGQAMIARSDELYIVDLRPSKKCLEARIPGAMCIPGDDEGAGFIADLPPTRTLVLYGADTRPDLPRSAQRYAGEVWTLDGGFGAFKSALLEEVTTPTDPTSETLARHRLQRAMHAYFTGAGPDRSAPIVPKATKRSVEKGGGC